MLSVPKRERVEVAIQVSCIGAEIGALRLLRGKLFDEGEPFVVGTNVAMQSKLPRMSFFASC